MWGQRTDRSSGSDDEIVGSLSEDRHSDVELDLDVVAERPSPPAPRRQIIVGLLVAAFVLGASVGYLIGRPTVDNDAGQGAPSSSARAYGQEVSGQTRGSAGEGSTAVTGTGRRCSSQVAQQLQLGVEIINRSDFAVTLVGVVADLPLGGLRATASTWGACGQLRAGSSQLDATLQAGATTWATMTFDVLMACPQPMPVLFTLGYYSQAGPPTSVELGGFADLGDVPYTGCQTSTG